VELFEGLDIVSFIISGWWRLDGLLAMSPLGLHENGMGGRLRTTDAALEYLWAGTGRRASTWMTTGAGPIVTSQIFSRIGYIALRMLHINIGSWSSGKDAHKHRHKRATSS
jgi:hypothetical protein